MSVETLSHYPQTDQLHELMYEDEAERLRLLDVADTIAAMEAQFSVAEPDERQLLRDRKDQLIDTLTAERPGHTLLNEVIMLASLYQGRTAESTLIDGSKVRAFGTRDTHGQYLEEVYVLHKKPDGGFHYIVRHREDRAYIVYELDDQAGLRIGRQANEYIPAYSTPTQFKPGGSAYQQAARNLLEVSLHAVGELRSRDKAARRRADEQALSMVEGSRFAARFLQAESSQDIEDYADELLTSKPAVLSSDAIKLIMNSVR